MLSMQLCAQAGVLFSGERFRADASFLYFGSASHGQYSGEIFVTGQGCVNASDPAIDEHFGLPVVSRLDFDARGYALCSDCEQFGSDEDESS